MGKPVFKLAPLGNAQMFDLTAPDLCVPDIPDDVLRQVILQASHPAQNRTANVLWPPFRLLAVSPPGGSRLLFSRFPFLVDHAICDLARRLTSHDSVPRYREGSQYQCSRPHGTLSRLFHTALWLGQCQSVLTQTQQPDDFDMVCCKMLPIDSVICSQVGPMSLEWPVAPLGGVDHSSLSPSREDLNDEHPEDAPPAPPAFPLEARCSSTALHTTR